MIIEAQFQFTPNTSLQPRQRRTTWNTAKALKADLGLTTADIARVKKAFTDRKITVS